MGSFINALFNFLLGWIRGTAQWLWNMVTSDSHGGLLGWAMRNWLPLVILLCIFGVVMDFLVYLIRWQPYRKSAAAPETASSADWTDCPAERTHPPAGSPRRAPGWISIQGRSANAGTDSQRKPVWLSCLTNIPYNYKYVN